MPGAYYLIPTVFTCKKCGRSEVCPDTRLPNFWHVMGSDLFGQYLMCGKCLDARVLKSPKYI